MKKKNLIIIFIILGIILITLGIILTKNKVNSSKYFQKNADGSYTNTSEELNKERVYKNLEFKNIKFTYNDNYTSLEFDAYNNSDEDFTEEMILISVVSKNNKVIQTILGYIPNIPSKEMVTIPLAINTNVVDAYDLIFEEYE